MPVAIAIALIGLFGSLFQNQNSSAIRRDEFEWQKLLTIMSMTSQNNEDNSLMMLLLLQPDLFNNIGNLPALPGGSTPGSVIIGEPPPQTGDTPNTPYFSLFGKKLFYIPW